MQYKCKHCYLNAGQPLANELTLKEIKKLLDDLYDAGTINIEFSGGEPLLKKAFIEILEIAQSADLTISICSNGLLGRELVIGCYLYILSAYVRWGIAEWEKEVLSLDS